MDFQSCDLTHDYTHYIAIDFGTSGCGMAVSTSVNPSVPHVYSNWLASKIPIKAPTILLLDDEGKFEAFGDKALKNYYSKAGLCKQDKADQYFLFVRFKMCLYDENLTRDMKIKAENGRELPAVTVISITLEYLKDLILKNINDQVEHSNRRIQWILTVPAIWSPAAKQIMREAAEKAGLKTTEDMLRLALEPEAAAMFCLNEICSIDRSTSADNHAEDKVSYYLLADCGGGTVDMAAHKMTKKLDNSISIEEIHQAHGGPYGGFAVNDEFEKMLQRMFQLSPDNLSNIKTKYPRHWSKLLLDEFELSKRKVDPKSPQEVFTVNLPSVLCKGIEKFCSRTIQDMVETYTRHEVEWDDDENDLVLTYATMESLYLPVVAKLTTVIDVVLSKPECQPVNQILLAGGFAENDLLFNKIEEHFSNKVVKRSSSPWLSVLKGAIILSQSNLIHSRKMRQTIGIETWDKFVPNLHKQENRETVNGIDFCKKRFKIFVRINQSVEVSETFKHVYLPVSTERDQCKVKIFGCGETRASYTDDPGCYPIGDITVGLPDHTSEISREITVIMHVSGTEITVLAFSHSSKPLPVYLDLIVDKYTIRSSK